MSDVRNSLSDVVDDECFEDVSTSREGFTELMEDCVSSSVAIQDCEGFPNRKDVNSATNSMKVNIRSQERTEKDEAKQENDAAATEDEEKAFLESFIVTSTERLSVRINLRQANKDAAANRPEEGFFSKLDSNLRKNTAFVKKVRNITEAQRESLINEMKGLNLSKYISEVASAVVEAKLKMTDIGAAVHLCSFIHQRYAEFSGILLENWQKVLTYKKDDKISNPSKLRVDIRFYSELIAAGVFSYKEGLPLLGNLLITLINMDKDTHNNLTIILSFCKHCGDDYAGLLSRKVKLLAAKFNKIIPRSNLLTPEKQKNVRSLLKDYYSSLCKHLLRSHKDLQLLDRQNRRILQTKGELSTERRNQFDTSVIAYGKLLSNTEQFADVLDENMPELLKDELLNIGGDQGCMSLDIHNHLTSTEFQYGGDGNIWEDEDMRNFYESLPDLKVFVPGDGPKTVSDTNDTTTEEEITELNGEDVDLKFDVSKNLSEVELPAIENDDVEEEIEKTVTNVTVGRVFLDSFLTSLPQCFNRELIDKAAVEFCLNLNTKPNRKKLVKTLFMVPRTRLDLLPFYARLVATLNPCMPDIANDLAAMLKQDFRHHIVKKDQINIESKVKTVRFIGELTKFKMYSRAEALYCLKLLLADFTHHHIEMTCNLLETAGRYLFKSADSHQRTKVYLEQMMRKKTVLVVDSRYITMVENAYYYCNPPETQQSVKKDRPPMHEYIRKLLYKDLGKSNIEKVLRLIRKLDWDNSEIAMYATKCLTAIWNVKYNNIRCVANLLAGLVMTKENIGLHVVDGVLEDIRLGMEINLSKYNQRRVSVVKYLGELYNYRMVESAVIFKVLYSFITFGVNYDGSFPELDPPDHLFRIRLVSILLETCGQYFNSGSSKKRLDCFLTYYQRYYWFKRGLSEVWNEQNPFPVMYDIMLKDSITSLRPRYELFKSYETAKTAVEELEEEMRKKLVEILPTLKEADESEGSVDGLETVHEVEEDENDVDGIASDTDDESESDEELKTRVDSRSQLMENEETGVADDLSQPNDTVEVDFISGKPKYMACAEDDDFMTAFDKMLAENIEHRSQESIKVSQFDMPTSVAMKSNLKKSEIGKSHKNDTAESVEETTMISFLLMTRRGNKQQFKNLKIPASSEIVKNLRLRQEVERAEREHVKKLTLVINERLEEEDYQEMLASQPRPSVLNLNRERRQKYQHPKGAPDVDLIFGNK